MREDWRRLEESGLEEPHFKEEQVRRWMAVRVCAVVAAQLCVALACTAVFAFHGATRSWVAAHRELWWLALILVAVAVVVPTCLPVNLVRAPAASCVLLLMLTVVLAVLLGSSASTGDGVAVVVGTGLAAESCLALAAAAPWGLDDMTAAAVVVGAGCVVAVFVAPRRAMPLILAALGAMLFSAVVVCSVRKKSGRPCRRHDGFVYAALCVYLDLYCGFLYMLSNVGGSWD